MLHLLSCISCVFLLNHKAGQATGAPRFLFSPFVSFVLFVVKVYLTVSFGCGYAALWLIPVSGSPFSIFLAFLAFLGILDHSYKEKIP